MKLLFCPKCKDIFNLSLEEKCCSCGLSKGKYLENRVTAEISNGSIALGFNNGSFLSSMFKTPRRGKGKEFEAFFIPLECDSIVRK